MALLKIKKVGTDVVLIHSAEIAAFETFNNGAGALLRLKTGGDPIQVLPDEYDGVKPAMDADESAAPIVP